MLVLLILDGLGVYTLNDTRLLVLGTGVLVILLPFFGEITVKDVLLKRNKKE